MSAPSMTAPRARQHDASSIRTSARVLIQASAVGRASASLAADTVRIGLGRSEVAPPDGDTRFRDPAWAENAVYRRLMQGYLAWCRSIDTVVDSIEEDDWRRGEQARFLLGALTAATAPTNFLLGNPAAMKRAFDTGGLSLVRGIRNWANGLVTNGGQPAMVKAGAHTVGRDLAITPGAVVSRDPVGELIQYAPSTEEVYERPTLVVPPPIGRYYFLDLAQRRSFVEYATSRGLQTFLLSWRNPSPAESDWGMDTYLVRLRSAIDEVRETTGAETINLIGFCAGGILTTSLLSHLAATDDSAVDSVALAVTLLDFDMAAPIAAFKSAALLSLARWNSKRRGVITARNMGAAFNWMRPNDLIWNHWVNNYLLGQEPPEFDILAWNADGTNLPAALHAQFLDIFENNRLVGPDPMTCLGSPVDIAKITTPAFVMGAANDHLTPWRGTYQTVQMLGGDSTYVLSNAGHIASLVNPPGNPRASYLTGPTKRGESADDWRAGAEQHTGSWWEHWADWTIRSAGTLGPAPRRLGSETHPVLMAAPGAYVRDEAP